MIKEIKEEIKFLINNPVLILILLTITGILPSFIAGILFKILGL